MKINFFIQPGGSTTIREHSDFCGLDIREPKFLDGEITFIIENKELAKKLHELLTDYYGGVRHGINCNCTDTVDGICRKYKVATVTHDFDCDCESREECEAGNH